MSNGYGNDSIRSLSDREAVRMRVSTYAGGNDKQGAFTTVREVIANSIDEFKSSHGDEILVEYLKDGSIKVSDKGRGCPVDWNEAEGKYNYQLIFESLNAGGKYSQGNYEFSLGLNGIGNSLVILSSEFANIEVIRDGYKYNLEYLKGINEGGLHKEELKEITQTSTTIHWKPDLEVFLENDFPEEWFNEYLEQQAIVNKGLRLVFINQEGERKEFYYENGIVDYLSESSQDKNFTSIQYFETEAVGRDREDKPDYKSKYQIAFCFNNEITKLESYHNSSYLKNGGSPHNAIKTAFTYSIDKLIKNKDKYNKKEKKITFGDIEDSLMIVSNTYSSETSYQNQTKFAITNKFIQDFMTNYIKEQLEIYFIENPLEADKIIERTLINKRSREKSEQTRLDVKKKLQGSVNGIFNKVEGLINAKCKDKTKKILCICEGKSSLSAMLAGRQDIHALLPIRGKITNCFKTPIDKALKSEIIRSIIRAMGAGIEVRGERKSLNTFNIDDLNFAEIHIYVDADHDGMGSILPLLLTVFWTFFPTLVEQGRIKIVETPKYEIVAGKEFHYAVDDYQLEKVKEELEGKKYKIHYVKGLSELSAETMAMCMRPDYENIVQITLDNIEECIKTLELFMGSEISSRREFILNSF
ncbi:toprim domain-containing protein [Priestia megaterium]